MVLFLQNAAKKRFLLWTPQKKPREKDFGPGPFSTSFSKWSQDTRPSCRTVGPSKTPRDKDLGPDLPSPCSQDTPFCKPFKMPGDHALLTNRTLPG